MGAGGPDRSVITGTAISEDEFLEVVRTFRRTAFRLETRESYALGYEREDFERFLAGRPRGPAEADWWQPWLERMARFTSEGKTVQRVRVLDEPPTDYQRWMLWGVPWHIEAGEDIRYITRGRAQTIGLPLDLDWWLLDGERLILMRFTEAGEIESKELITDPLVIGEYEFWQDLAVRHSAPADQIEAA
jgi:hypothetical protein